MAYQLQILPLLLAGLVGSVHKHGAQAEKLGPSCTPWAGRLLFGVFNSGGFYRYENIH